ncbi:helix-turn-helix domain-containing protein [Pseudonocardia endophytica]|uniref:AraC-like DNA-binding protein n=1 Tax=Pseudonocardia endophytica TaxID=401976 RepID=A0A4V2PJ24_PSEEN|nr:helix-turn-helix domain-containing protein [Pseudonocardia endophytica]TCK26846.1 AraC-like DNA-binding protein [Pseudonocardia endophytica]
MAVWDVAARPPGEQFGYWREVICEAFVPLTPSRLRATDDFHSRVETRPLGQIVRARLASQPQRTAHGAREVARTDGAYVFVNVQTAGTCAVEQGGRRAVVRPGRFTVVDTTEPYHFGFDDPWGMVSYRIPHAMIGGRLDAVRSLTGRSWDATGAGGVVTAVMASMWGLEAGAGTPDVEHAMVSAVSAVAAERAAGSDDRRAVLRAEIERHVERGLADPSLSVATVSREIGVSARTLHAAVSAGGETFAAMVRRRRLERAATLLADAGGRSSVTEIAASVGFDGPSSFSRAFRRRFGRTPTEARARNVQEPRTD